MPAWPLLCRTGICPKSFQTGPCQPSIAASLGCTVLRMRCALGAACPAACGAHAVRPWGSMSCSRPSPLQVLPPLPGLAHVLGQACTSWARCTRPGPGAHFLGTASAWTRSLQRKTALCKLRSLRALLAPLVHPRPQCRLAEVELNSSQRELLSTSTRAAMVNEGNVEAAGDLPALASASGNGNVGVGAGAGARVNRRTRFADEATGPTT